MTAQLEIRDGTPWWASPDIWVVPGTDPGGTPGSPVAGQDNYVWGRARNNGKTGVTGARVDFFWSNPATGVLRSNSQYIGFAYADLSPGDVKEVLCLTPWIPVIVNNGHECVVAQIIHAGDPLPTPLPDPFDPPTYRQVAQLNVNVVSTVSPSMLTLPIQVSASRRASKRVRMRIVTEPRALSVDVLRNLGLGKLEPADRFSLEVGFVKAPSCEAQDGPREVDVAVQGGTATAVYLQVQAPTPFKGYQLVHVEERADDRTIGGISFLFRQGR